MATLTWPRYGGTLDPRDTNDPRTRVVGLIPPGSRVLEVGSGSGTIAGFLVREKGCRVVAVEPDPDMAAQTRAAGADVIEGRIDEESVVADLAGKAPFDALIFADVLEHLADPWAVLARVRPWIASGGAVIASIPNVAHWSIRLMLLRGRWDYTDGFLMDRTHLRWFTRRTLRRLFEDAGYRVTDLQDRWAAFPGDRVWRRLVPGRERVYQALVDRWPGLFGYQFVVRAVPA